MGSNVFGREKRFGKNWNWKWKWGEMEIEWRIGIDPLFGIIKEMKWGNGGRQGVGGKVSGAS